MVFKYVLAVIIAVSLVKIAFFPGGGKDSTTAEPGANFTDPVVQAEIGDLTASVTLDASVVQDSARQVQAEMTGTIERVNVKDGDTVAQGAVIARIRQETPVDAREVTDAEGNVTFVQQAPRVSTRDVTAPVAGTVDVQILKEQMVSVGDMIATVQPSSTSVVASLSPEQRYRLVNAPENATVELRNGPGSFTCTGVKITTGDPASSGTGPDSESTSTGDTTARVRCAVPEGVTVFPGLAGTIRLETGSVQGAMLLPTTAVQGTFESGTVWVTTGDEGAASATPTQVMLGLTDGKKIEIVSGIDETQQVLEFAPVARDGDVASDGAMG